MAQHGGVAGRGLKVASQFSHTDIGGLIAADRIRSHYQPIVDLTTGAVVGYEALARGPHGPFESPAMLFAAARSVGHLAALDRACRRAAIRGAIEIGCFAPLTLFVNIEPETIDVQSLDELLVLADDAPGDLRLVLEITERALAARPAELLATVRRLRERGWRIALDDVGANDTSLAFMPLLRPDIIKLDLQLVQRRPSPKVAEIMNAVNAYAERTGSIILAEGIETEAHLAAGQAQGAQLGQGYLFGRPAPGPQAGVRIAGLQLPPAIESADGVSPFERLPASTRLRRSTKPLLIEVSKHLEREALRLGGVCLLVGTFQEARYFTGVTARRYRDIAERVSFVAAIGAGLPEEPIAGVRGATLGPTDVVRHEWDVTVLAPHFAAALIARDLDPAGPEADREFDFALTFDRETVVSATLSLMSRISPQGQ